MPASESPEAFGSPVPAYTVLPLVSVGSTSSAPIAFVANEPDTNFQCTAPAGSVAFFAVQTPPPAAPR